MNLKNSQRIILITGLIISLIISIFSIQNITYAKEEQDGLSEETTEEITEALESTEAAKILESTEAAEISENTESTETTETTETVEEDTTVLLEDSYNIYFVIDGQNQETYSTSYTGEAFCPKIIVKSKTDESDILDITSDDSIYTVTYSNNTNAGTATVTVYETENKNNCISKTFTINRASIKDATASLAQTSFTYKGTAKEPKPTVVYNEKTLKNNSDYTLSYTNNNKIGTATCKITGKGNYKDTISVKFKLNLNKAKITTLNMTYNSITIKWDATPGASKFVIYRSEKENSGYKKIATISESGTTSYKDTDVTLDKKYYYKVRAYSGSAYTQSNVRAKTVKLTRANITNVASKGYMTIKIDWDKVTGATGYYIYRSKSKNSGYKKIATVKKDTLSYKDKSVTTGVTYYYKVKAFRTAGGETHTSVSSKVSSISAIPSTPSITKSSFSSGNITLNWDKVGGASGYIIYRSTSEASGYTRIAKVSKNTLEYTDKYLEGDTDYYYKIRAYRSVNGKWVFSNYSKVVKVYSKYSRNAVVNLAKSWVGIKEYSSGHKNIVNIYNSYTPRARNYKVKTSDAWCATFVSAVSIKLGYTSIMPTECSCRYMIELFKEMGCWVEDDSYVPSAGDIIFYDWDDTTGSTSDNTGIPDHVGIVEKVVGNKITVIEGNYDDSVKRRVINVNGKYIRGYGVPNYTS